MTTSENIPLGSPMRHHFPRLSLSQWLSALVPPMAWATLIFVLSDQSVLAGLETNTLDFIFKKAAHMFVYAVLYLFLWRTFRILSPQSLTPKYWYVPVVICLLYAISDELHQMTVPGRHGTLRDVGFDMLGVSVAFLHKYGYI